MTNLPRDKPITPHTKSYLDGFAIEDIPVDIHRWIKLSPNAAMTAGSGDWYCLAFQQEGEYTEGNKLVQCK